MSAVDDLLEEDSGLKAEFAKLPLVQQAVRSEEHTSELQSH